MRRWAGSPTGHSLGGATATVLALLLRSCGVPGVRAVAFGAPPVLGRGQGFFGLVQNVAGGPWPGWGAGESYSLAAPCMLGFRTKRVVMQKALRVPPGLKCGRTMGNNHRSGKITIREMCGGEEQII